MSIHALVPLPIVLPLAVATVLAGVGGVLPRRAVESLAMLAAVSVAVACGFMTVAARRGTLVYWFGNWHPDPRAGSPGLYPMGICFAVEPMGAGLATLAATLTAAGLMFSWVYFKEVKALFHALMLAFLAAMCGMCLSGDLFNLFVWFELMTATAVALCGYESGESWPLMGSLNFAVVNSIGAFISLGGVALLYGYTGTLNMAEAGRAMAGHPPGATFVAVIFVVLCAGFLVKSALAPFHFWLADAHAVAPTPVCVLFSGVMVELGLFAVARLYWTTFAPAFGDHVDSVRHLLLAAGAVTAVVGAVYGFGQRHFKRMLAFSTVSHVGLMTAGMALQSPEALTGLGVYVVGHGLLKGTLFLSAGMLLHRCGGVDEHELRGRGRNLWPLGVLTILAALGLAGLPPFATFYGASAMHEAAEKLHAGWLTPVTVLAEALTAGAVLRMTLRIYFGFGPVQEATGRGAPHVKMETETAADHDNTPFTMWVPAAVLLLGAMTLAVPSAFRDATAAAAGHFRDTAAIAAATLDGRADPVAPVAAPVPHFTVDHAVTIVLMAIAVALSLRPDLLGRRFNWWLGRKLMRAMRPLRRLQSGNIGDYVAWLVLGLAIYGGLLTLLMRR